MMKNRKKTESYSFNRVGGIKKVEIADLKRFILKFETKLADPRDRDDKKWVERRLKRFNRELSKK